MPTQYQVTCTKCDYQSELIWLPWAVYQRPNGSMVELAQQLVWCPACAKVTFAEALRSMKTIEQLRAIPAIKKGDAYNEAICAWSDAEIKAVLDYTRYPGFPFLHAKVTRYKEWDVRQAMIMNYELGVHAKWRRARKSPAHCLTCGKNKFIPLPVDADENPMDTKHPGCGGTLKFAKKRKMNLSPNPTAWTPEGKYIGISKLDY